MCQGNEIVWVDRRSPEKAQFQGQLFDMIFTSKTEPPAERKLRRSKSLKQVTFVEESVGNTPARVKSAGSVLHREEHKETAAEAEKRALEKKAKERRREAEKFWRRFQKDMFESEAERIDVAPDVVENVYRESEMRTPFYLPEAFGTPCSLAGWPSGGNRVREQQGPATPPLASLLAALPALLALLFYALGQVIFDNISCLLMHYSSSTDLSTPSEALFITLYDSKQLSLLMTARTHVHRCLFPDEPRTHSDGLAQPSCHQPVVHHCQDTARESGRTS